MSCRALHVIEAHEGDEVGGRAPSYLAPAGRHLSFRRTADGVVVTHLDVRPLDTPHRPSVDVLFQSAATSMATRVLGVVMTGMGADGREGAAWIKAKGGRILTEAEDTCVVYGMPRSVVEAGLSDGSVPLEAMARRHNGARMKAKMLLVDDSGSGAAEHARDPGGGRLRRRRSRRRHGRARTATSSRSRTWCCSTW